MCRVTCVCCPPAALAHLNYFTNYCHPHACLSPTLYLQVNVGDLFQVLSNDEFVAPLHRVLPSAPGRRRYSQAFFFNPCLEVDVAPLPDETFGAPRYRPVPWGQFRGARFAGDYSDLGEEVQIQHWSSAASTSAQSKLAPRPV